MRVRRRILVLWLCAIGSLVAAAVFCWRFVWPMMQVRRALEHAKSEAGPKTGQRSFRRSSQVRVVLKRLGGPDEAGSKVAFYLRLPSDWVPHRPLAMAVLGQTRVSSRAQVYASLLGDPEVKVRREAAYQLSRLKKLAWPATRNLANALGDKDASVRTSAASALGGIGPRAKESIPALEKVLSDPVPSVRESAAAALGSMGPDARTSIPALKKALHDSSETVQFTCACCLLALGEKPEPLSVLEKLLSSQQTHIQFAAANTLIKAEAGHKQAIAVLVQALASDGSNGTRRLALFHIRDLGSRAVWALPRVAAILGSPEMSARANAVRCMGSMGSAASKYVPNLMELAEKDTSADVRQAAREALEKIKKAQQEKQAKDKQPVEAPAK